MTSVLNIDEYKSEVKMTRSPPHIFDSKLFDQWPDPDTDKLDLNAESVDKKKAGEKAISFDFEISESKTFPIEYDNGIFCMKYSPDGQYLAVGCADGAVRVLDGSDGKLETRFSTTGNMPVTSMKWKPSLSSVGSSSCLMTTSSSGCIDIWHVQSSKCIYSINEENNQIFAFDCAANANKFASAGKDKIIRVYDDDTKKLICSLSAGFMAKQTGHSNRIFALKWKPDDPNILISGGWDNCVLMWDLRTKQCFRSIFGPHIAGQTVDIQNDIIVTGSWRIRNTIELFEFSTGKPVEISDKQKKIEWNPSPMIYTLSYSPSLEGVIAAGGTGINTLKIINTNNGHKSESLALTNKGGIYCADWEPKGNTLAFAGYSSDISIVSLK